ncbi:2,5-diketo-D-gluconate reductase A [Friedmanniella endophytica]|uniref:2,5-diketo-D-gluconate reductase A n=1 Tax=Microlunatus kandeliicorticis TaxID=1759536 RepID=A0A7W3P504_9ACTN|nr:aldo/keto reductase [Microlunatus kandeliicorticis]MBA8793453.1 2,5-diketo-D-gluconate reductase A [Microlunatus kandeliicorticis]
MTVPTITLNDGLQIPQFGLGVWQVSTDDIEPAVGKALEVGYRHIDTAAMYGNEEGVGRAIAQSGIARDELWVTTKLNNNAHGFEESQQALKDSLGKLGLDHVDLYLIHWPLPARNDYVDTWKGLVELQKQGLTRSIGVSNFQPDHLDAIIAATGVTPSVNQVEIHPTFTQTALVAKHQELGVHTEAWSPLGQAEDLRNETVTQLADKLGKTPAQVILRWHLQKGYIVFPKSVTPSRIEENFQIFDFELTGDDVAAIDALDEGNRIGPDPDQFN